MASRLVVPAAPPLVVIDGPWMQVGRTGRAFPLLNLEPGRVNIEDIVPALSRICRFNGHTEHFYSVAQHSVHVSSLVPKKYRMEALLHDAAEAYTQDIPTCWKQVYRKLAPELWAHITNLEHMVHDELDIPRIMSPAVKFADGIALATEKRDLLPTCDYPWAEMPEPDPKTIIPLPPKDAEFAFWGRYYDLIEEMS